MVNALVHAMFRLYRLAMDHMITPDKGATEALRLPLDHFTGWRLAIDCSSPECARGPHL